MRNWISKINCLALVMLFFFAGCQQKQEKILDVIDREPNLATIRIPSDYEARSIETTGGLNAWTKIKKLQLDCLATFYQPDGSFYLTEQQYIIYPWSNSIDVFGREPQGNFAWRLSQGQFEVLQGNRQIANIMTSIDNQYFTEAILGSVTAPVRLLDNSMEFTRDPNPINIQGKWYYPIERRINTDIESILRTHKTVFYQNRAPNK